MAISLTFADGPHPRRSSAGRLEGVLWRPLLLLLLLLLLLPQLRCARGGGGQRLHLQGLLRLRL